jgi:hypothetical protein
MRNDSPSFVWLAAAALVSGFLASADAAASDWISAPSYYSHDPHSGARLQQYSPIGPFYTFARGDYRRSGYRQTRSSIQAGGSADHMHIVEEWGRAVRPYGEWRFPYRPHSAPYDYWAPPFGNVGPGAFGPGLGGRRGGPVARPPAGGGGGVGPGGPVGPVAPRAQPYPGYSPQPWHDGRYAPYDSRGPHGYPDLLIRPPVGRMPPATPPVGPPAGP